MCGWVCVIAVCVCVCCACRYDADALVLSFILVNLRRYAENAAVALRGTVGVRLPDAEGTAALIAVLEDVEHFYQVIRP